MQSFTELQVGDRLWIDDTVQIRVNSFNKVGTIARCTAVEGKVQTRILVCDEIGRATFVQDQYQVNPDKTLVIPYDSIVNSHRPTPTLNLDKISEEYDRIRKVAESVERHAETVST